jgi:protein-disulfide isomerase
VLVILLIVVIATSGSGLSITTGNAVAEDAVQFINTNLLQGQAIATLSDVSAESGVYKISINVQGQPASVYVTKDSKLMFLQAIPLTKTIRDTTNNQQQNTQTQRVDIELKDDDHILGDENAPVTIIEYSDFQCPYCGRLYRNALKDIKENYVDTGKVKFVFRHFPLSFHEFAQKAAEAAECAGEQGKFWEYHDKLFENQNALKIDDLKKYASELGLDTTQFNDCLDSGKYKERVKSDSSLGQSQGVSGTPASFVNGIKVSGAQPFSAFQQIIEAELAS